MHNVMFKAVLHGLVFGRGTVESAKDIIDIMFKLRAEAYSIWTLTFLFTTAAVGWLVGQRLTLDKHKRIVASSLYLLFIIIVSVAFTKTYDELHFTVQDLNYFLANHEPSVRLADDGALSYWRKANYRTHAYYAYVLNSVFVLLVGALIWRPLPTCHTK